MTTQLYAVGGTAVTVRNPDTDFEAPHLMVGTTVRTLNGALKAHWAAEKVTWNVNWTGLTTAEATTIMTELRRRIPMTWSPPNTVATYTVMVLSAISYRPDGFSHAVSAYMEEV